jgi:hypothetical protein
VQVFEQIAGARVWMTITDAVSGAKTNSIRMSGLEIPAVNPIKSPSKAIAKSGNGL